MTRLEMIEIAPLLIKSAANRTLLKTKAPVLEPGETMAVNSPSGEGKRLYLKSLFGWSSKKIRHVGNAYSDGCQSRWNTTRF